MALTRMRLTRMGLTRIGQAWTGQQAAGRQQDSGSAMKITVERSGGFAAITRVWSVQADTSNDRSVWQPIVEACPWDSVPDGTSPEASAQPDRFMYSIRAGEHEATLPERAVTGPWRVLVDRAKATAEASRSGRQAAPDAAGTTGAG
jgi:hypothetical protein